MPGHTAGHVAYFCAALPLASGSARAPVDEDGPEGVDALTPAPVLFCGDTLFSLGCGRLLEGTAADMFHALSLLKPLPAETLVCCGHEYTASNARR